MRYLTGKNNSEDYSLNDKVNEEKEHDSSIEIPRVHGHSAYPSNENLVEKYSYNKPYVPLYSNNSEVNSKSHLQSEPSSPALFSSSASNSEHHLPISQPEYQKYSSDNGSRILSTSSSLQKLVNHQNNLHENSFSGSKINLTKVNHNGDAISFISDEAENPFTKEIDFSPFGGYPTLSFPLYLHEKESDDHIHNPDESDAEYDKHRFWNDMKNMDRRSMTGLMGIIILFLFCVGVFILLPVLLYSGALNEYHPQSYEVLSQYHYPILSSVRTDLVDPDTPEKYRTKKSREGDDWVLVFSDEFAAEGRTFYEGDDQFFTAVDLHYDATKDLEWYDPDAATTANGTLNLRMDAFKNHDLFYRSGMMQTWNKFCFTQGHIEISARLPNYGNISGLWPGLWTCGNLGRPGYLATTEGTWPYSYDSCDAGITPNQSSPDGISYLPGQKLNLCTCKGADHPSPGIGRGAPEIDIIEAEMGAIGESLVGLASQSFQVAPFDVWYMPNYDFVEIYNKSTTVMNSYAGGPFQQAISAVTTLNTTWYEFGEGKNFQSYAFEYLNDDDTGYVSWFVGQNPTWTMKAHTLKANGNIGDRKIAKEPMSIIVNFGLSNNWSYIDWNSLHFPFNFQIDYVRVYQPKDKINVGCSPNDYPTYHYIQNHLAAYQNVNHTSWKMAGFEWPKNKLTGNCK